MTCAASGDQVSLLLAATLRSVNGPGASMAPGQAAATAASYACPRRPGTRGAHIAELWAGRKALDALHRSRAGAEHGGHVGPGRAQAGMPGTLFECIVSFKVDILRIRSVIVC